MLYVVIFFMFNDLRGEVIVHFVDIDGIVDHKYELIFLFTFFEFHVQYSLRDRKIMAFSLNMELRNHQQHDKRGLCLHPLTLVFFQFI